MISKHFVKVLFPFRYEREGCNKLEDVTVKNDKGNDKRLFVHFGFDAIDLRKGVKELFSKAENMSKIVDCYRVDYDARACIDLPRRKEEFLSFYTRERKDKDPYAVSIGEICLYLFESGVGFVEMECGFESSSVSDYISCNYFLAEVKSGANYFITQKRVWNADEKKEEKTEIQFTVKTLLKKVLDKVPGVKDFYSDDEWEKQHEKGMIYSYLYLEEKTEDFGRIIHNIRNNYKESYKVVQGHGSFDKDPNIRQQFENSYWVTSYNGTINVSHKTDSENTNHFFEKDFFGKMHNEYYALFLAVLHQRFVLLKAMTEMIEISKLDLDYDDMKQQLVEIRDYKLQVSKLECRAFFEKPSYVQHVNDYYELIKASYCIKELDANLSAKMKDVEQICNVYVEKIRLHEDRLTKRRNARVEIFVSIFGTIVGVVSVMSQALGLLEKVFGIQVGTFSIPVLLTTLILWIPSVVVCVNVVHKVKEIKELTKDIERENPEPKQKKKAD